MERVLRISYFIMFPIVLGLIYFFLKREGGMAMGALLIFFQTSIPFLLINIGRSWVKTQKANL